MGMTLLLTAMDITEFRTSENCIYLYVTVYFDLNSCMIYLFCCLFSFKDSVYTLLFNKCINENISYKIYLRH